MSIKNIIVIVGVPDKVTVHAQDKVLLLRPPQPQKSMLLKNVETNDLFASIFKMAAIEICEITYWVITSVLEQLE